MTTSNNNNNNQKKKNLYSYSKHTNINYNSLYITTIGKQLLMV